MNSIFKTAYTLTLLVASTTTIMAADITDLTVLGEIMPGACMPSFAGGGEVDYGLINAGALKPDAYNVLPSRTIDFSISCDAAAKVAFSVVAGRPNTLVSYRAEHGNGFGNAVVAIAGGYENTYATGVGLDAAGNKIGGMAMNIRSGATTIDGSTNVDILIGRAGAYRLKNNRTTFDPSAPSFTWGVKDSVDPLAFTNLTSTMIVQAYLNKGSELDLTQAFDIDGLVTFELQYI